MPVTVLAMGYAYLEQQHMVNLYFLMDSNNNDEWFHEYYELETDTSYSESDEDEFPGTSEHEYDANSEEDEGIRGGGQFATRCN